MPRSPEHEGPPRPDVELPAAQHILRRAVQLDRDLPAGSALSAEALESAAAELGVDPSAVAHALAEARLGVLGNRTALVERVIGPRRITVVRTCQVSPQDAARLVAQWFEQGHLLRVTTGAGDTIVGRRRTDAMASAGRAVRSLHGEGGLSKVREVRGAVGSLADGTAAIGVQADVSDRRNNAVAMGSGIGTLAVAGVGVATVVLSPLVVLATPAALAVGVLAARQSHRDTVRKVRQSLEETTDAVAQGTAPSSTLSGLGRSLRRLQRR